jgi:hypothetical protein
MQIGDTGLNGLVTPSGGKWWASNYYYYILYLSIPTGVSNNKHPLRKETFLS